MNFISGGLHATNTLKNELLKLEKSPSDRQMELSMQMDKIMENTLVGVQRVTDIVTSLQFFSNPGNLAKTHADLNQLLYTILLSIEKSIPCNVNLTKDIPAGTTIFCYEEQLQQVFIHILQNALSALEEKENGQKKIIHISVSDAKRNSRNVTCISFTNNGPLIPEKEIKKIFDPFFTLNDAGKGRGLGMTVSYMIVKEHQGWIEIRNDNGLVHVDVLLPKT
jgi:signal transduction histidine kinase